MKISSDRLRAWIVDRRLVLRGLLAGVAVLIYDEIITSALNHYCYPYPVVGCIGDAYVASSVPFILILAAVLL